MRVKISLLFSLCLGLLLLAGCGYSGTVSTPAQNTPTLAPTATAVPRITPGTHPTATPSPAHIPVPGSGQVVVQLSALTYRPGASIGITILNRTSQRIVFSDHQSECSVVLLQHQTALSWEPVALCKLMIVTRLHELAAGASQTVSLMAPVQPAGTYRVVFSYNGGTSLNRGSLQVSYSPQFQVQ
jgi:hypothetical protein